MITSTTRDPTQAEKLQQLKRLPGVYARFEDFGLMLVFIVFILLVPFLFYERHHSVTSKTQGVVSVAIISLSIFISNWLTNKWGGELSNSNQIHEINTAQVEVIHVKTNRAVKREDPEDFGVAFYVDVHKNGQQKTLYVWGQYLDELEYGKHFPNTEFEIIRKAGSDEFISFKVLGEYFKAERVLPAFSKSVWKSGYAPLNGQLLNDPIDAFTQ